MEIFREDDQRFQDFIDSTKAVIADISGKAREDEIRGLESFLAAFRRKTDDFYRENRKLNIGVVGQVKAGKSSFLNTLLFNGQEILPKAATPKTATLTKMEYAEENVIQIEYYSPEEWDVLEDNAQLDLDDEIYTSAREIVDMVKRNGIDPRPYLERGSDRIEFSSYEELIAGLNDYVGEDGKYTPIVKAVILYMNKEEFRGLSIVDTPGLNDPIASRTIRTKEFIEVCDVVFFLSQAGSFLDKSDWILLSSQLPQKGVQKLVLIASKYDSGIRDILRPQDPDDIFGEDENTSDNIPGACRIIQRKLRKRAKGKVQEFVKDLEERGSSPDLIDVIRQCSEPVMVSSLAHNMVGKPIDEYSPEEKNIYAALKKFSDDIEGDLKLLGSFDKVKEFFNEAVQEKEQILEMKAKSLLPKSREELKEILRSYMDKAQKRAQLLEINDKDELLAQKKIIENQMGNMRADIAALFGELNVKLESEKAEGIREIRKISKDYLALKDRTGTKTVQEAYKVSDAKWWNPFSWFSSHTEYRTYEQHYSYCIVADAIENLKKYAVEASGQVEEVFSDALQVKEIKRKLLNVIVDNFDMGSEKYDSSLFRIMVEETVSSIVFPVLDVDISDAVNGIAGKFTGELTSADEKTKLSGALTKALSRIYEELSKKLDQSVKQFKTELNEIRLGVEENLLADISREFEVLLSQCENKEKEINELKEYAVLLENDIRKI